MKNTILPQHLFLRLLFIFVFASSLLSCSGPDKEDDEKMRVEDGYVEDTLDLSMCPMYVDTAIMYIDSTNILLKLDDGRPLNYKVDSISKAALEDFRIAATEIHAAHNHTLHFVTAIKMHFALYGNTVKCLYEPLSLCSTENRDYRSYSIYNNNKLYVYSGGMFSEASTGDVDKIENYQQRIRFIDNPGSTQTRTFVTDSTAAGDTESIVYSFQEMDSVMLANGCTALKVWNCAYRKYINGTTLARQSLLLSPDTFDYALKNSIHLFSLPFKGRLADDAKPCPPDCNNVTYRVVGKK